MANTVKHLFIYMTLLSFGTEITTADEVQTYNDYFDENITTASQPLPLSKKISAALDAKDCQSLIPSVIQKMNEFTADSVSGLISGSYLMGRLYESGTCVEKDLTKALESYKKAARYYPAIYIRIGYFHEKNWGVGNEKGSGDYYYAKSARAYDTGYFDREKSIKLRKQIMEPFPIPDAYMKHERWASILLTSVSSRSLDTAKYYYALAQLDNEYIERAIWWLNDAINFGSDEARYLFAKGVVNGFLQTKNQGYIAMSYLGTAADNGYLPAQLYVIDLLTEARYVQKDDFSIAITAYRIEIDHGIDMSKTLEELSRNEDAGLSLAKEFAQKKLSANLLPID